MNGLPIPDIYAKRKLLGILRRMKLKCFFFCDYSTAGSETTLRWFFKLTLSDFGIWLDIHLKTLKVEAFKAAESPLESFCSNTVKVLIIFQNSEQLKFLRSDI